MEVRTAPEPNYSDSVKNGRITVSLDERSVDHGPLVVGELLRTSPPATTC